MYLITLMEKIDQLRKFGLFDAKVPRYTSYPPSNHFMNGLGQARQAQWLNSVREGTDVSLYIHIPFCKRLCWFCACRTQGTKTLRPVDAYVEVLRREISAVRHELPQNIRMARLHLGGGTPTILSSKIMSHLLDDVFGAFDRSDDFEFSVEIDPTEASDALLSTLLDYGMNRASLGVQDFAPVVQDAIGRAQSLEQTRHVVDFLRERGLRALNLDLLYGLPHQTMDSFAATLQSILSMEPDRLAIYGYAHVPWMSKRQVMIDETALPDNITRFALASLANDALCSQNYHAIGIDHFALETDSLYKAQQAEKVRRNFQGYTDDQCATLVGLGASSISRFEQGFVQNAPATSAYQERIQDGILAGHKGYVMSAQDQIVSQIVEDLLCRFRFDEASLKVQHPTERALIEATSLSLQNEFPEVFESSEDGLEMNEWARPLVRIVASHVDQYSRAGNSHSAAI